MNTLIHSGVYNASGTKNSLLRKRGIHGSSLRLPATFLDIADAVDRTEILDVVSSIDRDFCYILDFAMK